MVSHLDKNIPIYSFDRWLLTTKASNPVLLESLFQKRSNKKQAGIPKIFRGFFRVNFISLHLAKFYLQKSCIVGKIASRHQQQLVSLKLRKCVLTSPNYLLFSYINCSKKSPIHILTKYTRHNSEISFVILLLYFFLILSSALLFTV